MRNYYEALPPGVVSEFNIPTSEIFFCGKFTPSVF